MFKVIKCGHKYVFLQDVSTGVMGSEAVMTPGSFVAISGANGNPVLHLEKVVGLIGQAPFDAYALTVSDDVVGTNICSDVTAEVTPIYQIAQPMARDARLAAMPEEDSLEIRGLIGALDSYQRIHDDSRLFIPKDNLVGIPMVVADAMTSGAADYHLPDEDNQEIYQKNYDSEFGVHLPTLESIHADPNNALGVTDLLRVTMPYRQMNGSAECRGYKAICHTPFVHVSPDAYSSSEFNWMTGFTNNDEAGILPFERHMATNLKVLVYSDIAKYIDSILTGIFLASEVGIRVKRFCVTKDTYINSTNNKTAMSAEELKTEKKNFFKKLLSEIKMACGVKEYNENESYSVSCSLTDDDVDDMFDNWGWDLSYVGGKVRDSITLSDNFFDVIIEMASHDRHVIDCDGIPFRFNFSQEQRTKYTDILISRGYMTMPMLTFLQDLIAKAYRVNWGHTGLAGAIRGCGAQNMLPEMDAVCTDFINAKIAGQDDSPTAFPAMYYDSYLVADDDEYSSSSTSESEDEDMDLDAYFCDSTLTRIHESMGAGDMDGGLGLNDVTRPHTDDEKRTMLKNDLLIEGWRDCNAESNLVQMATILYTNTGRIEELIDIFIKCMRWGQNRPRNLRFDHIKGLNLLFSLNDGVIEQDNTYHDESDLVANNGQPYTLGDMLVSGSNFALDGRVLGFEIIKNYQHGDGPVYKETYLASWADIAEMVTSGNILIGDLLTVSPLHCETKKIEGYVKEKGIKLYESDEAIQKAIKYSTNGAAKYSTLTLLYSTPNIMSTSGYLESIKRDPWNTYDRQCDILHNYTDALEEFYNQFDEKLSNMTNTTDIKSLAAEFGKIWAAYRNGKPDHNETVSKAAIGAMNFVSYEKGELSGKFALIVDPHNEFPKVPAIEFTDPTMKNIANSVRNRIVALMNYVVDGNGKVVKVIIARQDIKVGQVMTRKKEVNGAVKTVPAANFFKKYAPGINAIYNGHSCNISGAPLVLHESCKRVLKTE